MERLLYLEAKGEIDGVAHKLAVLYTQERLGTIYDEEEHYRKKGKLLYQVSEGGVSTPDLTHQLAIELLNWHMETCDQCHGSGVIMNPSLHTNDPSNGEACEYCASLAKQAQEISES